MYFTKSAAAAILAFVPTIFAQSAANMVTLGAGGNLQFNPNTMTVNQGDNVTFAFMSATHSVASTSLSQPNVADNQIFSGRVPVDNTTPTPPGTKLPRRKLRIRATGAPPSDLEARAKNNNNNNNNNANTQNTPAQSAAQNGGVATFTVQMNNVGMQAIICEQAQHAANGMIMMINVLPSGQQKRQNSDAQLQQALTNYLQVGQNTKTTAATANPGVGGQLNAVANNLLQTGGNTNTNTGKKGKKGKKGGAAAGGANAGNAAGAGGLAALLGGGN